MEIRFVPLFSGSSGNCTYVAGGGAKVLVDAGVSASRACAELEKCGIDIRRIDAILVTHEHDDHIKGINVLVKKYGICVYATPGTWDAMGAKLKDVPPDLRRVFRAGEDFYIGDLGIMGFPTPHDCGESVGYTFSSGASSFSIATDIGAVRESWLGSVYGSQAVLLESNYDRDMLMSGPYPYSLKRRIDSTSGHLSNDDAAKAALKLLQHGTNCIVLGHLSEKNNFPELAYSTCEQFLRKEGYIAGRDYTLAVASRSGSSGSYLVESGIE